MSNSKLIRRNVQLLSLPLPEVRCSASFSRQSSDFPAVPSLSLDRSLLPLLQKPLPSKILAQPLCNLPALSPQVLIFSLKTPAVIKLFGFSAVLLSQKSLRSRCFLFSSLPDWRLSLSILLPSAVVSFSLNPYALPQKTQPCFFPTMFSISQSSLSVVSPISSETQLSL